MPLLKSRHVSTTQKTSCDGESHGDVSGLISVLPSSAKSVVHKCER